MTIDKVWLNGRLRCVAASLEKDAAEHAVAVEPVSIVVNVSVVDGVTTVAHILLASEAIWDRAFERARVSERDVWMGPKFPDKYLPWRLVRDSSIQSPGLSRC